PERSIRRPVGSAAAELVIRDDREAEGREPRVRRAQVFARQSRPAIHQQHDLAARRERRPVAVHLEAMAAQPNIADLVGSGFHGEARTSFWLQVWLLYIDAHAGQQPLAGGPVFRRNGLKSALLTGTRCTGAWLFSGSPAAGEILGLQGFDALVIDQEHSPHGPETTIAQMRAIAAAGPATILVRVPDGESRTIKLALDSGAEGVLVPTVESAAEARAIVAACRYPPDGRRGAHHTIGRAADWGRSAVEYLRRYPAELLIVAMIESERGLNAAADIAGIEGIDMLFLGPLDLTASFGCMGDFADARITGAVDHIARACGRHGKYAGAAAFPGFSAPRLFELGHGFVTVGSDVTFLQAGAAASLREVEETACTPAK